MSDSDVNQPMAIEFLPGNSNRFLLADKEGEIWIVDGDTGQNEVYMDLGDNLDTNSESGVVDITLDPDFENNDQFYVYWTPGDPDVTRISQFTHEENQGELTSSGDDSSENVVWDASQSGNYHIGGSIDFGPEGAIWLTHGEQNGLGGQGDDVYGKVIRVNPDGTAPSTNPYVDDPNVPDEVFAYGLRNPFRSGWDLQGDNPRYYIGDVGGNSDPDWEEINVINPDDIGSGDEINFGWDGENSGCEGVYTAGSTSEDCDLPDHRDPFHDYQHTGEGAITDASVTEGTTYHGPMFPNEYQGAYFFADQSMDWLKYMTFNNDGSIDEINTLGDDVVGAVDMEVGNDGALYIVRQSWQDSNGLEKITYENPTDTTPDIDSVGTVSLETEETQDVTITASDADGDSLTLSASGLPSFASFTDNGDDTGTLSLTPGASDDGSYQVTVTAEDDDGNSDQEVVDILVTEPGASSPDDFDGDGVPNDEDDDDDNDGLDDTEDHFAIDPEDGTTTTLPVELNFEENSHPNTILGVGFTGLMQNGENYADMYDESEITVDGSITLDMTEGDANVDNDQDNGFQVGFDSPDEPYAVNTTVNGLPGDSASNCPCGPGIQLGNGDQPNFIKLVLNANGGDGAIEFGKNENNDFNTDTYETSDVIGTDTKVGLSIVVDPSTNTAEAFYKIDDGEWQSTGITHDVPASWLDSSDGTGTAAGLIGTTGGNSPTEATWDYLHVETLADTGDDNDQSIPEVIAGEDGLVSQDELLDAVFYHQSGDEVPNTGGQTIDQDMLLDIVFYHQSGEPVVSNNPPTAEITMPSDGDTFQNGDTIDYAGTGSDPDETLNDSNFEWDIGFVHNQHTHPQQTSVPGQSGSFVADIPDSHDDEDNLGYELILTVTDSQGATDTDSVTIDLEETDTEPEPSQDDFDGDGTLNENDPDDDNDGLDDTEDHFAIDPEDGTTTTLPVELNFEENSHPNTILGVGFTGLMQNGENYADMYDESGITVDDGITLNMTEGDANTDNDQDNGFQVGFDSPDEPYAVNTTVNGIEGNWGDNSLCPCGPGIQLGNGDQQNFVKLVLQDNGGDGGIEFGKNENNDFETDSVQPADVIGTDTKVGLSIVVDPSTNTVEAFYKIDDGEWQSTGITHDVPASWLDSSDGTGTAAGLIGTSSNTPPVEVTWDYLHVETLTDTGDDNSPPTADAGSDQTVEEGTTVTLNASESSDLDGDTLSYNWTQESGTGVTLSDATTAQPTFTAPDVDDDETLTFEVEVNDGEATDTDTVNVTVTDTDAGPSPNDFDGDGILNENDPDDDNDGLDDTEDHFAIDPEDGTTTTLPVELNFEENSHPNTILGVGFTGLMQNGENYADMYDESEITVDDGITLDMTEGDANVDNDQDNGFQVGFDSPDEPYSVNTTVNGLPGDSGGNCPCGPGIQLGNGDQPNFVKLVLNDNNGDGAIEFLKNENNDFTVDTYETSDVIGTDTKVGLSIVVDPSTNTAEAFYKIDDGEWQSTGITHDVPASWLDSSDGTGTAAGLIGTTGNMPPMEVTWDYLHVEKIGE